MESPVTQRELSDVQMKEQENRDSEETVETQSVFSQSFDDFALEKMKAILPSFKSFGNDPDVRKTVEKLLRKWKIRINKSKNSFLQLGYEFGNREGKKATISQIPANSSSVSRRRPGTSKGSARAKRGKPRSRRQNCLKININANQDNAKKRTVEAPKSGRPNLQM